MNQEQYIEHEVQIRLLKEKILIQKKTSDDIFARLHLKLNLVIIFSLIHLIIFLLGEL